MAGKKSMTQFQAYNEGIINTVREPLIVLDQDLRVVTASRSFYDFFKVKPEETMGQLIYDLGNKQWNIPRLRELLENILPEKTAFDNYEVEHDFATIGRRVMLLNARQIESGMGKERIILLAIEDITERSDLESLLEESEFRYRRIFETATDGIVLLEKQEGYIVHANPAAAKMLGYPEAAFIGKKLQDIGIPIHMTDFSMIMDSLNKSGIVNYEDVPIKSKSGQEVHADIYMVNRAKLAQCNIRDISERKRVDNILKEEKSFIENALNTLQDIFFVFDLKGRFLRWNKTMNAVTGFTDSEISMRNATDFFLEDDKKRVSEAFLKGIKEGRAYVEAIMVTKDGRQFPYAFNASILRDAQNKSIGISGVGRDITARNKAEADIRKSEERFRQIAQSAKEWIWEVDREGFYTYSSNVVEEILGYKPEEIVGKKQFYDFFPADQREQMKKEAIAVFAEKKLFRKHVNINVHKNGGIVLLETNGLPILDDAGNLLGYRGTDVDISEKQKLEAQLRHAQKMEAVGTLAGGIAHDFNNILNVIMGYGTMVAETLENGSLAAEDMNEVLIAADRAADLTRRLLIFSRKDIVKMMPVDINEIVLGLKKMLTRIIRESIEFNIELCDMPLTVMGDKGQIEQVLINMVVNSKDAIKENGRLTISTGFEEVDADCVEKQGRKRPGSYALITVADTGQGMDAATQKKMFEPFFSTKGIGEGTGLGLAISHEIIKHHGGYTNVYSEPGHGTVFTIYLPLTEEMTSLGNENEAAVPAKRGNETVLVAEDEASLRKLMTIVLESFGYSVITAVDGEDAIAKFMGNRNRISIVILDMIMPKKGGKEVAEVIRKVNPGIKMLFASGYTMDAIKSKELVEACSDFIHKPFTPNDLLSKVREILDRLNQSEGPKINS